MTLRLTLSLGVLAIGAAAAATSACSDSGGDGAAVGQGGAANVGGAAAAVGGGTPTSLGGSTGTGTALLPETGYIEGGGPDGRIWGAWYTFGGEGSVFTPLEGDPVEASGGQICFSGTVAQVIGGDYATYYGAEIGFDLCGMPGDMSNCDQWMPPEFCSWAPESKHTVSECGISLNTISFDITGTLPSTELRINFKETGRDENTYLVVASTGTYVGNVDDADVGYDTSAPPLNKDIVEAIHFQVSSTESSEVPFDFCISNLTIT